LLLHACVFTRTYATTDPPPLAPCEGFCVGDPSRNFGCASRVDGRDVLTCEENSGGCAYYNFGDPKFGGQTPVVGNTLAERANQCIYKVVDVAPSPAPPDTSVCQFTTSQAYPGSTPIAVSALVENLAIGVQITVTVSDANVIGDLRGVFFHVNGFTLGSSSQITGSDVTGALVSANNVKDLGNGANMNGDGNRHIYDVGVAIGTSGIGANDIQNTVIYVAWNGLTTANLCGQEFGFRLTSVGPSNARGGSSKIYGTSCACAPA
jgi:hypothetical protein